ncbi:MAG: C-GCAxxG-C-C family (seleno)protein [Gemmatimonadota bacterium]
MLDRAFGHPLPLEERATAPFAGGIMQHGYQCGMIWGAALAAGAEAYRRLGPGADAEAAAVRAAQKVVQSFRKRHDEINCLEITDLDQSSSTWEMINYFILKGGTVGCFRMASWYAPRVLKAVESSFSEDGKPTPPAPVSCAALMARKAGMSECRSVMASGLAGGVGLCGGACGALGAAVWILAMRIAEVEDGKIGFKDPRTVELIDTFLEQTGFEFECSKITGRCFEDVDDHAAYLRNGGCSELIERLAWETTTSSRGGSPEDVED